MMTIRCYDGHLWTLTSASSAKAQQLRLNDRFEFVAHLAEDKGISSLRASGRAEVIEDASVRRRLASSCQSFDDHWSSPDDPDFMLLRLDVDAIEVERGPDTKAERHLIGI